MALATAGSAMKTADLAGAISGRRQLYTDL